MAYRIAARRCSLGQRGLSTVAAVASRRSSALVTRISVAPSARDTNTATRPHTTQNSPKEKVVLHH
jgi:hypothetical protein